jgi:phenylalanyl-tRNA synthetase beta chain
LAQDALLVAEQLTDIGLAVDGVDDFTRRYDHCVIAEVMRIEPHPSRNTLRLVTLNIGDGKEQTVVCGAANVPPPPGQVILAKLGANLPGVGFALERKAIGGVPSEGMLCSEVELGVAEASEGIFLIEPGTFAPGTPLVEAYPELADAIFELDITPNRPDALGHVGVARDLAARLAVPFVMPKAPEVPEAQRTTDVTFDSLVQIDNQSPERCPRYGAAVALDVHIAPSPTWMGWRLQRLGIRPISNVVDITNWLLLLFGHPMHAFDLERVRDRKIIVRLAKAQEPFSTLDGVARTLTEDDLVIADGQAPSALAGIMGGADSEIAGDTKVVLLECAYFAPQGIRRTARRQAMHTESSHRFERGVDWGALSTVLEHAQGLLANFARARIVPGHRIEGKAEMTRPLMRLRSSRLNALLGITVPFDAAEAILRRLGFDVAVTTPGEELSVTGASYRPDVSREVDLIEEVARIYGLSKIPTRLPPIVPQRPREAGKFERDAVATAVNLGLSEALIYGFVAPSALEKLGAEPSPVILENPLSEDRSALRTSLLPGLLDAVGRARRRGEPAVRLFVVGSIFLPSHTERTEHAQRLRPRLDSDGAELPVEHPYFAAVLAGPRPTYLKKPEDVDVFDAKGIAVELCERLLGVAVTVRHAPNTKSTGHLHPRGAAEILVGEAVIGRFGPLHPDVVEAFDLGESLQVVEVDLSALENIGKTLPKYRPIPKLPAIVRDVSFELAETVSAGEVTTLLKEAAGELCESVELFDLFKGGAVAKDKRALAFRLVYRDPKARLNLDAARTLTDAEVDARQTAVVEAMKAKYDIGLRG